MAERRARAIKLRVQGKTIREIAEQLGIGVATAHLDVRTAMGEVAAECSENVEHQRGLELTRLERAFSVIEQVLLNAESNPDQGDELRLKALDRVVKLQEQRSKLLGLYAPERREIDAKVAAVSLDEINALRAAALSNDECPQLAEKSEPSSLNGHLLTSDVSAE